MNGEASWIYARTFLRSELYDSSLVIIGGFKSLSCILKSNFLTTKSGLSPALIDKFVAFELVITSPSKVLWFDFGSGGLKPLVLLFWLLVPINEGSIYE